MSESQNITVLEFEQMVIDALGEIDQAMGPQALSLDLADIIDRDRPSRTTVYVSVETDIENGTGDAVWDIVFDANVIVLKPYRELARDGMRSSNGVQNICEEIRNRLIRSNREGKFELVGKFALSPPDIGRAIYQVVDSSFIVGIVPFSSVTTFCGGRVVASTSGTSFPVNPPPQVGDQHYDEIRDRPFRYHAIGEWVSEAEEVVQFLKGGAATDLTAIPLQAVIQAGYKTPVELAIVQVQIAQSAAADPFDIELLEDGVVVKTITFNPPVDPSSAIEPMIVEYLGANAWTIAAGKKLTCRVNNTGATDPSDVSVLVKVREIGS